jgi:DNA-binding beta-propeller fold protein YncE
MILEPLFVWSLNLIPGWREKRIIFKIWPDNRPKAVDPEKGFIMKIIISLFVLLLITMAGAASPGYQLLKKLQIGGDGFWDYLTVDDNARRLYVSHGTQVQVIDLETEKIIGEISDTPGVHGIAIAPEFNRGFISCGRAGKAVIFDLKTLHVLGEVKTGENPDAIRYDTASKQVFVFNGRSRNATVFKAADGETTATIELGGKPEFSMTDGSGRIYVNIEDMSEVVEIDSRGNTIRRRFSISPGEEPTGMGFDIVHHRIFSGCSNGLMTVLDTESGKLLATVPIGAGCDGAGFDPGTGLAFSSNGEGTLTVVQETSPGKFEVVQTVETQAGARTMAIDPKTHNIYLPTAQFGPAPAPTADVPHPRRTIVSDSFVVLVVGK